MEGAIRLARLRARSRGLRDSTSAIPTTRFTLRRPTVEMPFASTNHGRIPPLAERLYNQCVAGIALSFTNASLVPDEMLACGAIPVVGESVHARACLDNPYVRWAHQVPSDSPTV